MSLRDNLLSNTSLEFDGRLFHQKNVNLCAGFLDRYLEIREKEGRLYKDEVVANLPLFGSGQVKNTEWSTRAYSAKILTKYLATVSKPKVVMELGCGNGWLSASLAKVLGAEVCGIDINSDELYQAARVFSMPKLFFVNGDVMSLDLPSCFDAIILAGSIQYFSNVRVLMDRLFALLNEGGEVHILDSPIYGSKKEGEYARARSKKHFDSYGVPEMHDHYFQHSFPLLKGFKFRIASDPKSLVSIVNRKLFGLPASIFPWIIMPKQ